MSDTDVVAGLLAAAGIHPHEAELQALGAAWPGIRDQVDGLYAVDCGDESPASMLRADLDEAGPA